MAQRTLVELIDDIDGGAAHETVSFGLDGTLYEIDLAETNAERFRGAIAEWITAGRRTGKVGRGTAAATQRRAATDVDPAAVRAWASSNGIAVSARGRVPASVIEQFRAAGN